MSRKAQLAPEDVRVIAVTYADARYHEDAIRRVVEVAPGL